jgi:hypothetical protein
VKFHILSAAIVATTIALSMTAQAQGIPDGVVHGGAVGMNTAGPVGAVVGGAVGGVVGGVEGLFGVRPYYASYPEGAPRAYRYRHGIRHTYRHPHQRRVAS